MFTDVKRAEIRNQIATDGVAAFTRILTPEVMLAASERAGTPIIPSPLNLCTMVWLGISAAMQVTRDFGTILTQTLRTLEYQRAARGGPAPGRGGGRRGRKGRRRSKHCPYGLKPNEVSGSAFCQRRRSFPPAMWTALLFVLAHQFEEEEPRHTRFGKFRLLAMDGTMIDVTAHKRLRSHFGQAKNKSGLHTPQARMLMLAFPLARIPVAYELAANSVSELKMARRLAKLIGRDDMVLLDAGFWSYGLFCDIHANGGYFAIRGKDNILLKQARRLGTGDRLVDWTPCDSRGNWRKEELPPTMRLREITYRHPGFRPQRILTNQLDPLELSRKDWTRLAKESDPDGRLLPPLFHLRWEIETLFRELKVEQGLEKSLRGRTKESIEYEVAGHVVHYLLVRWLIAKAATHKGVAARSLSFVQALGELKDAWPALLNATPAGRARIIALLILRIAEHPVRYKPGRQFPRRKKSNNYRRKSEQAKKAREAAAKAHSQAS